jgi:hypothetical protein
VSGLYYARLREMEKSALVPEDFELRNVTEFHMELHEYFREKVKGKWWYHLRSAIWVLFLWVLIIIGISIILH